ncbi:MAG: TonB-dependent receptor [Pseudomonadota bacterium]
MHVPFGNGGKRQFHRVINLPAIFLGLCLAIYSVQSFAQDGSATLQLDLTAGKLSDSVNALAREANITLSVDPALVEDMQAPALNGEYSIDEAFEQLLQNSELEHRFLDSSTVVISLPDSGAGLELDATVVTGELQERNIQDSQTSVAIVSGNQLETRNDSNLRETATRIAGVNTSSRGIGFVIRGIDERGVSGNGGSSPLVTTSIDGAQISNFGRINTTFISTWDLEQVEFLRGPQSTQSGRNALAGAVVVRSKDPTYEDELKLRLELGNVETFERAVAFNQPLSDKIAMRLSAAVEETDGFIENTTLGTDDEAGVKNETYRAAFRFDPSEALSAVLKFSYLENDDGFASSDTASYPDLETMNDAESSETGVYRTTNLRLDYEYSNHLTLRSETTFVNRDFDFTSDFDGTSAPDSVGSASEEGESMEQDIKLLYSDANKSAVVGFFATRIDDEGTRFGTVLASSIVPFAPPGATITGRLPSKTETTNYAIYGEIEYDYSPEITLIAGGRFDHEEQDSSNQSITETNTPALAPFLPPDTTESTKTDFDTFLPKLGIVYNFTEDMSLGFTYQQGYRSGGATFNFFTTEQFDFDPEFTENYEFSFRSFWMDGRTSVNANLFFTDWEDQQVRVFGPSGNSLDVTTQNAGESELYGLELEVRSDLSNQLEAYGSLGYTQTEFKDFISNGEDFSGNEFRNAPELTAAIGATYFFNDYYFFAADVTYTDESFSDAANTDNIKSDDRTLLNLRFGYERDNFFVFAYINNARDEEYIEEGGVSLLTAGEPRTYGVVGQINLF